MNAGWRDADGEDRGQGPEGSDPFLSPEDAGGLDLPMKESLRILLVAPRLAEESHGGAEYLAWGLARALAHRGHRVEVFTTCAGHTLTASPGYLIWDNSRPAGEERRDGVIINRFPVSNPGPLQARRARDRVERSIRRENESPSLLRRLAGMLETGVSVLGPGWYYLEEWEDGPARWNNGRSSLFLRGRGIREVELLLFSPQEQEVRVEGGGGSASRSLKKGEEGRVVLRVPPQDILEVTVEAGRVFLPQRDRRRLGVALRLSLFRDGEGERTLDPSRDLNWFVDTAPEEAVFELLSRSAGERPGELRESWDRLVGPISPGLLKALRERVGEFDVVIAGHFPHATLAPAIEVADAAGTPSIAVPLFHLRDRYQYWPHLLKALRKADAVDANTPRLAEVVARLGAETFAAGVGLDLAEFDGLSGGPSPHPGDGQLGGPLLLWVGRKNRRKGYPEALRALSILRGRGIPATLLMVGGDEDGQPLSGEGVVYAGPLPRDQLLRAYRDCDIFILPSRDESFGIAFCEAWLAGKPVLGWKYCSATRDLVRNGENGYLCGSAEELAEAAEKLIKDGKLAAEMGQRGRAMVAERYSWERVAEQYEREIVKAMRRRQARSGGGMRSGD